MNSEVSTGSGARSRLLELRTLRKGATRGMSLLAVGALSVATLATIGTSVASAVVPTFPDNVVVFPDRDFVTIEGYQDHLGETAIVEVKRRRRRHRLGAVRGRARRRRLRDQPPGRRLLGRRHHPQGHAGHPARRRRLDPLRRGASRDTTTTADAFVDSDATLSGNTLTVKGHIGAGVNQAQIEQRIINPDLVDTDVGPPRHPRHSRPADPGTQGWLLLGPHVRRLTPSRRPTCSTTPRRRRSPPRPAASGRCPGRTRTATPTGRA